MDEGFEQTIRQLVNVLECRPDFKTDPALRRIVEILSQLETPKDLSHQQGLITYITLDSLDNQETGNIILEFLRPYKK